MPQQHEVVELPDVTQDASAISEGVYFSIQGGLTFPFREDRLVSDSSLNWVV